MEGPEAGGRGQVGGYRQQVRDGPVCGCLLLVCCFACTQHYQVGQVGQRAQVQD